jgi:hypothetical protein
MTSELQDLGDHFQATSESALLHARAAGPSRMKKPRIRRYGVLSYIVTVTFVLATRCRVAILREKDESVLTTRRADRSAG